MEEPGFSLTLTFHKTISEINFTRIM